MIAAADFRLSSLEGMAEDRYNHLSVRSAVAIYLDRLAQTGKLKLKLKIVKATSKKSGFDNLPPFASDLVLG